MSSRYRHLLLRTCFIAATAILTGCSAGKPPLRPETQVQTETLLNRGFRAEQKNDSQEAERLFTEALAMSASIEDWPVMAKARINLARLNRLQNKISPANSFIDDALSLLKADGEIYAEAAQEKALIELASGNTDTAGHWAQRSVTAEQGNYLGRRLNLLGRILLAREDPAGAKTALKKALEENRTSSNLEEEANTLRMLGIIARKEKGTDESAKLLTEALEIDKLIGRSAKIATDLEELATTALTTNNLIKTVHYLERAYDVNLNGGRFMQAAANQSSLAEIFSLLGDTQKKEQAHRASLELAEKSKHQLTGIDSETTKPSSRP